MADSVPISAPITVSRAQLLKRRARLRTMKPVGREVLLALAEKLSAAPGVTRVLARPSTGSLILETCRDAADVLATISQQGVIDIAKEPRYPSVREVMHLGLLQADSGMQRRTGGALDLRTTLGVMLAAGAMLQLARGRVAGPATTLAMAAYSLLATDRDEV